MYSSSTLSSKWSMHGACASLVATMRGASALGVIAQQIGKPLRVLLQDRAPSSIAVGKQPPSLVGSAHPNRGRSSPARSPVCGA